jgi:hypothetical protein
MDDPYGLPRFADEEALVGWDDRSDIAMRSVRIFTRGPLTATVIAHPGVWDLILSDGRGNVTTHAVDSRQIAALLAIAAAGSDRLGALTRADVPPPA